MAWRLFRFPRPVRSSYSLRLGIQIQCLGFLVLGLCSPVFALTIDQCDGDQSITAIGSGTINQGVSSEPGAVGGTRAMQAQVLVGGILRIEALAGSCFHSQNAGVTGISTLTWDGDLTAAGQNPIGLGGLDLTQDGGTGLRLKNLSFDFPSNSPAFLVVTIYDASDVTGNKYSSGTVMLNRQYNNETLEIPFSLLTITGPSGAAQVTNVGAIKFSVVGQNPALDMDFSFFGTNGICELVPVNGRVIDQCGVCGGNNSTCLDCMGVPNGGNVYDQCGICGGNGTSCLDCKGNPFGTAVVDECGVCEGDSTSCLGCTDEDQTDELREMDNGAKEQEDVVKGLLAIYRTQRKDVPSKRYARDTGRKAHQLQLRNWRIAWINKRVITVCTNQVLCQTVSLGTETVLEEYRTHAKELRDLAYQISAGLKKRNARSAALLVKADKLFNRLTGLSTKVIVTESHC